MENKVLVVICGVDETSEDSFIKLVEPTIDDITTEIDEQKYRIKPKPIYLYFRVKDGEFIISKPILQKLFRYACSEDESGVMVRFFTDY